MELNNSDAVVDELDHHGDTAGNPSTNTSQEGMYSHVSYSWMNIYNIVTSHFSRCCVNYEQ